MRERRREDREDCASSVRCSACGGLLPLEEREEYQGKEREREKRDNKERRKRRKRGVKGETSRRQSWSSCSYVLHTLAEHGERGLYMLLHCGAQCSIISPSIPSALIDERVRRAGARESGRVGGRENDWKKKRRKRRRGCRWPPRRRYCIPLEFFKSGSGRTSARNKDLLSHTQPKILGEHGSLDRGRTAKHEIAPKITTFWIKPPAPPATKSSSGVEWNVPG